ncbi:hypothetical protein BC833DRAFT_605626 [Globomyces pollinis-pini]|nr:hypothetical protein BC833DRAFT_605626 [Globomyces pollinis-pini]
MIAWMFLMDLINAQSCMSTNAVCVPNQPVLWNSSFPVYWASNILPINAPVSIDLYSGSWTTVLNGHIPCQLPANVVKLQSLRLTNTTNVDSSIFIATATLAADFDRELAKLVDANAAFFLHLKAGDACLDGAIEFTKDPNLQNSTVSNNRPTPSNTNPQPVPSSNNESQNRTISTIAIIAAIVIAVIILLIFFVWFLVHRRQLASKDELKPLNPQTPLKNEDVIRIHVIGSDSPESSERAHINDNPFDHTSNASTFLVDPRAERQSSNATTIELAIEKLENTLEASKKVNVGSISDTDDVDDLKDTHFKRLQSEVTANNPESELNANDIQLDGLVVPKRQKSASLITIQSEQVQNIQPNDAVIPGPGLLVPSQPRPSSLLSVHSEQAEIEKGSDYLRKLTPSITVKSIHQTNGQNEKFMDDYEMLKKNPVLGIQLIQNASEDCKCRGIMFVKDGPYIGGAFEFEIESDVDYPNALPKIRMVSPIEHPMVDPKDGQMNTNTTVGFQQQHGALREICNYIKLVLEINTDTLWAVNYFKSIANLHDSTSVISNPAVVDQFLNDQPRFLETANRSCVKSLASFDDIVTFSHEPLTVSVQQEILKRICN